MQKVGFVSPVLGWRSVQKEGFVSPVLGWRSVQKVGFVSLGLVQDSENKIKYFIHTNISCKKQKQNKQKVNHYFQVHCTCIYYT